MEYSPMMVVMLWALTPSDCWPIDGVNSEQARVVEMPQPVMSVHPEGAYFTFNHGRPFLVEKDPLTGNIDSNIKTTPVTGDDYLYEEYEESGESIDRKDTSKIYTRNDIAPPSKDSDLHKFLNLPVHYSSTGKFPLISSSYANTKVQGHGPLSNHKLHSSSSTTSTVSSPSYYPLKTTASPTTPRTTTNIPSTSSSLTTTTVTPSTQTTTDVITATATAASTGKPSSTTTTTTKPTISYKPFFSNYEYEYDYDYDKNEGENAENTSHDYEFLGASSEVTKGQNKFSAANSRPPITTSEPPLKKEQSTTPVMTSSPITTLKPTTSAIEITTYDLFTEIKPSVSSKENEKLGDLKGPNVVISATVNQADTVDLRPPKPELSVELKPPHLHPTRPFSSVVATKPQTFGQIGFVKYPESTLLAEDKRPVTFYKPQNVSSTKSDIIMSNESNVSAQQEKLNSSDSRPYAVTTIDPQKVEETASSSAMKQAVNNSVENDGKLTPLKDEKSTLIYQERPQELLHREHLEPNTASSQEHSVLFGKPFLINKTPLEVRPDRTPTFVLKRPQDIAAGGHLKHEESFSIENKYQVNTPNPEHLNPQRIILSHSNKAPGMTVLGNRPVYDQRVQVQGHIKPSNPLLEMQSAPIAEIKKVHRPVSASQESGRYPTQTKLELNRLQTNYYLQHNKPHIHYNPEQHGSYHVIEPNRPHNPLHGLRTERPTGNDRPLGLEQMRPHIILQEQKKTTMMDDIRPQGTVESEVSQGASGTKPLVFSKSQAGKRPDYNTVQFGQPSKVENHFISVSPGQENPNYSLQTSFSIGVPPPEQKQPTTGGHGVGQVLFPDEDSETRTPVWPQQRPPVINQPENHPNIQVEKYPRPQWESHLKPPHIYQKKEQFPPIKRKPLPNILPQFRPNAKIGYAEPHIYLKPREPFDTLQPPPLPRPQFLRLEQELEEPKPLVHRRNGQSSTTRVTTLQMIQGPSTASKHASLRIDDSNEKNEPVFVVYPSNGNSAAAPPSSDGVVVGTRGPHRPLPPDNLDIGDDLDSFPLDSNKNFQTRVDTPVLKSKPPPIKPIIKNEFPYTLIKPNSDEKITPGSVVTKDYTAFSPTLPSTEKEHDTEINIIPYLQDYMPFATKKPHLKDQWLLGTDIKHVPIASSSKQTSIEMTQPPLKNDNHRVENEGPQPQDFQAPFHASLTAPSQGWSVVQKKPTKESNSDEGTTSNDTIEVQTTSEPKFDIQNFKPQLFGGFKPIVPQIENEEKDNLRP